MQSLVVASLLIGLMHTGGTPAVAPQNAVVTLLDVCWVPSLGRVSVSSPAGTEVRIAFESDGRITEQGFILDSLPRDAHVTAAKIGPLMESGLVVALATREGESTSYYFLCARERPTPHEVIHTHNIEGKHWGFSQALFTSTGEPYRIVDARGSQSGDGLELTYRRGWPKINSPEAKVDEKLYFNTCVNGDGERQHAGVLFDVGDIRARR